MSKKTKKRRSTFPEQGRRSSAATAEVYREQWDADMPSPGIFGFFREVGVRETIESLLLAVLLALLFRAFESEAFIIPTGSMAPSLNGQHYDLECNNCDYRYHSGTVTPQNRRSDLKDHSTFCPVCQYPTLLSKLNTRDFPDHVSNNGDRILVNKFIYDFSEPERFDVIVFKNPNNGKQNYIKRLIGLPGDNLAIESGDVKLFEKNGEAWDKKIARKPAHKLKHILQVVDDTHHIGDYLKKVDWPLRWQDYSGSDKWSVAEGANHPIYKTDGSGNAWLRYRHFQPRKNEWDKIDDGLGELPRRMQGELPKGELITDQYSYNDLSYDGLSSRNAGCHWVGDIGLECEVNVESNSGQVILDVVEGGVHFQCVIDAASGKATLRTQSELDSKIEFVNAEGKPVAEPTAATSFGQGSHRLMFVNADDQLHLWVDGYVVEFDAATYTRGDIALPYYSPTDAGDAEPVGVGSEGAKLTVDRLKVVRDVYYTSTEDKSYIDNEARWTNYREIYRFLQDPDSWSSSRAKEYFGARKDLAEPMFLLKHGETSAEDQFLPMGDNSPNSLDGRFWTGRNYVQRDMLIGRATFVFWPHTVNSPFRLFPNFWEMGFIK